MGITTSLEISALLGASDSSSREMAWEKLISTHTRLLIAVARSFGGESDEMMDRYAYILEKFRETDFRRLRTFDPQGRASFATWLTVTARRLCLDHKRGRYGRRLPRPRSARTRRRTTRFTRN